MQSLHPLTPSQLSEFLLHVATVRPVFIWGAPGIGKSALVQQFAESVGLDCVSLLGSQLAPEDLIGVPQIEGGVSRFCPPAMIARPEPYWSVPRRAERLLAGGAEGVLQPDPRAAHRRVPPAGQLHRHRRGQPGTGLGHRAADVLGADQPHGACAVARVGVGVAGVGAGRGAARCCSRASTCCRTRATFPPTGRSW